MFSDDVDGTSEPRKSRVGAIIEVQFKDENTNLLLEGAEFHR